MKELIKMYFDLFDNEDLLRKVCNRSTLLLHHLYNNYISKSMYLAVVEGHHFWIMLLSHLPTTNKFHYIIYTSIINYMIFFL